MSKWIDATSDKWFSKDVDELTSLIIDGSPFFSSTYYGDFRNNKAAFDYVITSSANGQFEFYIPYTVDTTVEDEALVCFANGIRTPIADIRSGQSGDTYIRLRRAVSSGTTLRFHYTGEPQMKVFIGVDNTPVYADQGTDNEIVYTASQGDLLNYILTDSNWYKVSYSGNSCGWVQRNTNSRLTYPGADPGALQYPSVSLIIDSGFSYIYDPFNVGAAEVVKWNGKQLKRVSDESFFKQGEEYCIRDNTIIVPYELNNEALEISFNEKNDYGIIKSKYVRLTPTSDSVLYKDRFFPDCIPSRCELFTCINILRMYFIRKFTDSTPWRSNSSTSRFDDVQEQLNLGTPWWWVHVRDLENIRLTDGRYLLTGVSENNLGVDLALTRSQLVVIIDKFRLWCIDALK